MLSFLNQPLRRVPTWTIYAGSALWCGWLFFLAATGQMGPEPIKALEHAYGIYALKLIVAILLITPLRKWAGLNLLRFRRALGVSVFFVVLAHFAVWAILDVQTFARVWADIVKRPYVTIGMASLLLMLPLAITSNDRSLRKLGAAAWRRLHLLTYPVAVLAGLHFVWLVKGFQIRPLLYLLIILGLLALRVKWKRRAIPA
ncbi:MAG TPA: protein-methionine-sulfoxide reductase heme-binding subunit MsrQ [Paracoccaceae bacterium]|nr:protein-methionine-sulfoxide reductase heme-binding subunit MsrQ [Paracoccaceae bacterium]